MRVVSASMVRCGLLTVWLVGVVGCQDVDCEAVCQRTLACEVTFAPLDDPAEERVARGDRTALQSCTLGCSDSPTVTPESAACIDDLTIGGDPAQCQSGVVTCLGVQDAIADDEQSADDTGGVG
jgi:hypothetical protein